MTVSRVGIVGYGVVGKVHCDAFTEADIDVVVYDRFCDQHSGTQRTDAVNHCDLVFICVPTPSRSDGSCDVSIVEEVVRWVNRPICIKSTIPPGTTDRLVAETGKQIVFSPEYTGETVFHPHRSQLSRDIVAVGGQKTLAEAVVRLYSRVLGPQPIYLITDAITAELSKYMENCYFATKVAFVAQFLLLARSFNADFTTMREIWTADSRVGRSHSTVVGSAGFDGKCLPKDLAAILAAARATGCNTTLLKAVEDFNKAVRANPPF